MAAHLENQQPGFQKCYHHSNRQAVVRCPSCGHHYCRECVTEHDDRMLCTHCLKKVMQKNSAKQSRFNLPVMPVAQFALGFVIFWYGFYLLGKILLAIPSSFHEGTIWETLRGLFS